MSRMLEISTCLPVDTFIVQRFSGREELARPYEYRLELLSEHGDLTAAQLLGTNATVALETPSGGQAQRYFNGYITRFSIQGMVRTTAFQGTTTGYLYLVTLNPGFWFRTRASNSRIFEPTAIGDLIEAQLLVDGLTTVQNTVTNTQTRNYIVQYRETDFNFISRLMEHAGVYYYFTHANGSHTMVLVNAVGTHLPNPQLATIAFAGEGREQTTLHALQVVAEVQAGAFATGDYNYVMPNTQIASVSSDPAPHANAGFEMFDHPVDSTTGAWAESYAKIRAEELACRYQVAHGSGVERNIQVGFKTTVQEHAVASLNQEYLVIGHSFEAMNNMAASAAHEGASFTCSFEAIPSSVQFRAARTVPRPAIAGTQTALVVADFHNDTSSAGGSDPVGANMGRVKVQFFWDRYSTASCWARVSTPWAGKGYGFQNMPRVGEEVLVQFLEGDPDRPVVIGRVHNAVNLPPFTLPGKASITGLKTLSIDGSGTSVPGKWNELRFDDNDGSEQIYVQAQKDYDRRVLNDQKIYVAGESHSVQVKDVFEWFKADRHEQTVGDHNNKIGGSWSHAVAKDVHLKVDGNILHDAGKEVHLKGGMKIVLEAATQISLKVGGNFIDIGPAGIAIKGTMVQVNSGGAAGSGTDCAPIAARPATEAMSSDGGSATASAPAPAPPKQFSAQATSFKVAAVTGAPFVAPCTG